MNEDQRAKAQQELDDLRSDIAQAYNIRRQFEAKLKSMEQKAAELEKQLKGDDDDDDD